MICTDKITYEPTECNQDLENFTRNPRRYKWYAVDKSEANKMPDHFLKFIGKQGNALKLKGKNGKAFLLIDDMNIMQPFFDQVKKGYKIFVEIC